MTFQEVLAQVIDWLQHHKRLSYRALKRQWLAESHGWFTEGFDTTDVHRSRRCSKICHERRGSAGQGSNRGGAGHLISIRGMAAGVCR